MEDQQQVGVSLTLIKCVLGKQHSAQLVAGLTGLCAGVTSLFSGDQQ